ncbi:MAG: hypothetical protein JRN19_02900 [Nitrososphaerota archaeon]|nr:hypothetical protein [Nitrososphaerota archaeon]MDG7048860.1 hypothetical protein [Nitrososphaerota archaeon]MDG7051383.1 hypothetical protein [Nitrososphaerota archaeon]
MLVKYGVISNYVDTTEFIRKNSILIAKLAKLAVQGRNVPYISEMIERLGSFK